MSDPNPSTDREIDVFNRAKLHPPGEERRRFVEAACDGDASLCAKVDELLRAHDEAGSFLNANGVVSPEVEEEFARLRPEEPGDIIGNYKLLQQIGEGGFGTVWMAEQSAPVKRRVALKIIKLGMDTKEVVARFEQERQALALMDHPNIARVYDAGATPLGRPYFVMELVRGIKITAYCDEQELSTRERVELFIHVCQAVQHAHQKGIIHRDLKPSNILVTINDGEAVPKVIDFGVAKATQGHLSEATLFTRFEQMIGTPLYMSPEQAEMTSLDIDTRSDIYSLGVLLYELLTGKTPIDTSTMARAGMDEIRRIIREVDPPKPSARLKTLDGNELTTTAKRRHTDAGKLPGALRGDIDWIVMKCLEKDRKRRYETANGLAADLQRHLCNEVVIARPPTAAYLLGKLIKRNKLAFSAAAGITVSILVGMTATAWQLVQTRKAEHRAVAALDELRATAPAFADQARALAAKERYDEAIEKLEYAFKLRPDDANYLVAKADLLQAQSKRNQLSAAAAVYREALRLAPGHARAEASAKLCDELLAAKPAEDGELSRESLAKLHLAIQQQQRPVAELIPVARMLGEEKKLLLEHWVSRLRDLPVSTELPLEKRLTMRDDGRLALDLSNTKVVDVAPLAGAPLAALTFAGCAELKDLAPLRELKLDLLDVTGTGVSDLTPLRDMSSLETLLMGGSQVTDLTPLSGLRLKKVDFSRCAVTDLTPIRHMALEVVNLAFTRVSDLTPVAGMPVKTIDLTRAPVLDFSPLAKLPLEKCYLQHNRISDLAVFRGKPLKELALWGCVDARNYSALADIKTLELLLLPSEYRGLPAEDYAAIGALRNHPNLRQIGSEIMSQMGYGATGSKELFWQDWEREQAFVPAIRKSGYSFSLTKLPGGAYQLTINRQSLSDLSFLKGAPLGGLNLLGCKVSDLSPIRNLRLTYLWISENPVADLSPLRGMPIESLSARASQVSDLSPLAGLPLKQLYVDACPKVTDVSALAQIPTLERLTVPMHARNIEKLRQLPNLQMLDFRVTGEAPFNPRSTTKAFWERWPTLGWARALNEAGIQYTATQVADGPWKVAVTSKDFSDCSVFKGAAIRELDLRGTKVADLRPLAGLALNRLDIRETAVTDLSPLRDSTLGAGLRELLLWRCKIKDFSPVVACASLEEFDVSDTEFSDLSVLRGRAIQHVRFDSTKVTDLSPLAGMPIKILSMLGAPVTDVSPLLQCPKLETVVLSEDVKNIEVLRAHPGLKEIASAYNRNAGQKAADFWKDHDTNGWIKSFRAKGITVDAKRESDGTWTVRCTDPKFADLQVFRGANIGGLYLRGTGVSDLSPLRGVPLRWLSVFQTAVADLQPLEDMALRYLDIRSTNVTDLAPLRSPPLRDALKDLRMYKLKVTDFSPIAELKNLEVLDISACPIDNLEILRGRKLRNLHMMQTNVRDLSILAGMPLEELQFNDTPATDLRPLLACPTLRRIVLPAGAENVEALRALPGLTAISYECQNDGTPKQTAAEFWSTFDERRWIRALEKTGIKPAGISRLPAGTWDVDFHGMQIGNVEMLKGAPISVLRVGNTGISDLTPLRGMPLERLLLYNTKVSDLSPLRGMKLTSIHAGGTPITDISALRGMPLKEVKLHNCPNLIDLSPLADARELIHLTIPARAKNFEFLRALPKLERISYWETTSKGGPPNKTAEEFWKEYDAKRTAAPNTSGQPAGSR